MKGFLSGIVRYFRWHLEINVLAIFVICAIVTANPLAAQENAPRTVVLSACSPTTRLILLQSSVDAETLTIHTGCADDNKTSLSESSIHTHLLFPVKATPIHSIFSPDVAKTFEINTKLGYHKHADVVHTVDKRPCATIIATTQKPQKSLARFIASNGDWESSVDYLIDEKCSLLIAHLGNQLAVTQLGVSSSFDLYGIHFDVTR